MYRIVECMTQEHQLWLAGVAGLVCVIGSVLSVRLTYRHLNSPGVSDSLYLGMIGIMAGSTLWSTHFIAMLAYDPGFAHGYEPLRTAGSLVIAVLGTTAATALLKHARMRRRYMGAGVMLGLTISTMHYLGMSAYLMPGSIAWHVPSVASSVLLGIGLSIAAYHRVMHPVTRYCWIGGAALMTLAICTTHFVGMSAISIHLSPLVPVPQSPISDSLLGGLVVSVVTIILMVGFASFSLETRMTIAAQNQTLLSANTDALTGLANRKKMLEDFDTVSARLNARPHAQVAILFIDLNLFKSINDLHGHRVGDAVLKTVAERLRLSSRGHEVIARVGGDEFVILMPDIENETTVLAFAQRMHAEVSTMMWIDDLLVSVGAAIGIATSLHNGREMDDLLHRADLAMYRAKQSGQNICVFDPEMDTENREELQLISDLRHACGRSELEIVYQLQNDLESLEPIGFEALLRWNHPVRGRVMPGVFIPVAEKAGLIREIGLWVLREACHEAAGWDRPLTIAVNVAPQQLVEPLFVENVALALHDSGLAAARLEIEVTEEGIIEDMAQTLVVMGKLKKLGVRLAMDDFGTGYSSLSMLQSFPFDKIKIDRSFVQDVHVNPQRAAIVRSTLVLGAALNIPILAEGVETNQELEFLQSAGCTTVQGFYFGKPMALMDMRAVVNVTHSADTPGQKDIGNVLRLVG